MIADQMVLEVKLGADSLDSSTIPDLSTENILYYLNVAQEQIVKTRYSGNNQFRTGFQQTQKRTDDLKNITGVYYVPSVSLDSTNYTLNFTTLFSDENLTTPTQDVYMFYLRGNVKVTKTGCGSTYVGIKIESLDDMDKVLRDPFKRPSLIKPVGYFQDGGLTIATDGTFTVDKGRVTVLRMPKPISNDPLYAPIQDCELDPHIHREIVAMAIQMIVGDIKPEKFQTKVVENTQIE